MERGASGRTGDNCLLWEEMAMIACCREKCDDCLLWEEMATIACCGEECQVKRENAVLKWIIKKRWRA